MSVLELKTELKKLSSADKAASSAWFFKTGLGQYGEGDVFIGVSVPEQRAVAKKFADLPLPEVEQLLKSKIHEERLVSVFILCDQYKKGSLDSKKEIYEFYLANSQKVNNWDLVDSSASYIVGQYLLDRPRLVLYKLAKSTNMWERRIAMVATSAFINAGESSDAFAIAELLLNDKEDLMHKAVGWMLREVGKRVSKAELVGFLQKNYKKMPRTALRYSIEHFPESERQRYLKGKV